MALIKSNFRKNWNDTKTLVGTLWDASLPKGDYLDMAAGQVERVFPVRFDLKLGPTLDKLDSAYKSRSADASEASREKLAEAIKKITAEYRKRIDEAKDELNQADAKIVTLLTKTLRELDQAAIVVNKDVKHHVKRAASPVKNAHKAWKDAKKASEKAHKQITANKDLGAALKNAKLHAYPFQFEGGLGPLLEKIYSKIAEVDQTGRTDITTALELVGEYAKEVAKVEKRYREVITGGNANGWIEPVVKPLEEGLKTVREAFEHLKKRE